MIELLLLTCIFLVSAGSGKKFFAFLNFRFDSFLEELLFSAGLGLGLLSIFTFLLGILKLLYPIYAYLLLALCGLISYREIVEVLKNLLITYSKFKLERLSLFNKLIFFILSLSFLVLFVSTFNPPIDIDALHYHLSVPKIYTKNHGIIYIPYNFLSNLPFLVETLFTFTLLLKSDFLAQQVHLLFGILSSAATFLLARRYFSFETSFLAAAIFFTIPTVLYLASIAFIDLALPFFFTLAVYAYFLWNEKGGEKWIFLAGLTGGFTAACKYQGFIPAFLLGLFLLFNGLTNNNLKKRLRISLFYYIGVFLPPFPWLVKNLFFTGNPFYPLGYRLFGGRDWSPEFDRMMTLLNLELVRKVFLKLPILPWAITMEHELMIGKIGPIFLAFLPLIAIFWKKMGHGKIFFILFLVIGFFLLFPHPEIRYWLPVLPLLSVATAKALEEAFKTDQMLKVWFSILLILSFFIHFLVLFSSFFRPPGSEPPTKSLRVIFGLESREQYLSRVRPYYPVCKYINQNLPKESKVLTLWGKEMETGGYYIEKEYILGSPKWQAYIDYSRFQSPSELLKKLKKLGVTHIFFVDDPSTLDPDFQLPFHKENKRIMGLLKSLIKSHTRLIFKSGKYQLLELE